MTKKETVSKAIEGWTESNFCKGHLALDSDGYSANPCDLSAIKWCALGRLFLVGNQDIVEEIRTDFRLKYGSYKEGGMSCCNDEEGLEAVKEKLEKLYD